MFCTKCGKELHDEDRFCAYCGAAVRETQPSKYDDVVFNPPFKVEAQRRTEEILKSTDAPEAEVKKETVSFEWNLDGFPSYEPKETEPAEFNWDSVVERKKEAAQIKVEKIEPEQELFYTLPRDKGGDTKEVPAVREPFFWDAVSVKEEGKEKKTDIIEELERELLGGAEEEEQENREGDLASGHEDPDEEIETNFIEELILDVPEAPTFNKDDERFYTYNQKFDAFQELLEKERDRLKTLEDDYNKNKEALDYTWVNEVFPELDRKLDVEDVAEPPMTMTVEVSEASEEINETAQIIPDELEGIDETVEIIPDEVKVIDEEECIILDEFEIVDETEHIIPDESDKNNEDVDVLTDENPTGKEKLRYSDVFPRSLVDNNDTGADVSAEATKKEVKPAASAINSIYDEIEEDEPKKHIFAKVIISVLLILIVAEGIVIAAKFLAPESKISLWANDIMLKAADFITGGSGEGKSDENQGDDISGDSEKTVHMSSIIAEAADDVTTIGETLYNPDLTFDKLKSYSFDEIPESEVFADSVWLTDDGGQTVTYGQGLIKSVLRYYDSWQAVNTNEALVGINSLEVGEIRTGAGGFYVLCKVTYAGANGGKVKKYHTVYMRISGKTMIINEIKEDNL